MGRVWLQCLAAESQPDNEHQLSLQGGRIKELFLLSCILAAQHLFRDNVVFRPWLSVCYLSTPVLQFAVSQAAGLL